MAFASWTVILFSSLNKALFFHTLISSTLFWIVTKINFRGDLIDISATTKHCSESRWCTALLQPSYWMNNQRYWLSFLPLFLQPVCMRKVCLMTKHQLVSIETKTAEYFIAVWYQIAVFSEVNSIFLGYYDPKKMFMHQWNSRVLGWTYNKRFGST